MTYQWRTYGSSRIHHVSEEGTGKSALCSYADGRLGATTIKTPGGPEKCIRCGKLLGRIADEPRFEEVE